MRQYLFLFNSTKVCKIFESTKYFPYYFFIPDKEISRRVK